MLPKYRLEFAVFAQRLSADAIYDGIAPMVTTWRQSNMDEFWGELGEERSCTLLIELPIDA